MDLFNDRNNDRKEILISNTETPHYTTRKIANRYIEFNITFRLCKKNSDFFCTRVYQVVTYIIDVQHFAKCLAITLTKLLSWQAIPAILNMATCLGLTRLALSCMAKKFSIDSNIVCNRVSQSPGILFACTLHNGNCNGHRYSLGNYYNVTLKITKDSNKVMLGKTSINQRFSWFSELYLCATFSVYNHK